MYVCMPDLAVDMQADADSKNSKQLFSLYLHKGVFNIYPLGRGGGGHFLRLHYQYL